MPSSPRTPNRRPTSSGLDFSFTPVSSRSDSYSPVQYSRSRESSIQSSQSPSTPRPDSAKSNMFGTSYDYGNGLGSLADELEEAWEEEEAENTSALQIEKEDTACNGNSRLNEEHIMVLTPSPIPNLSSPPQKPKHRGKELPDNKSDNFDLEENNGISASLNARLATIEGLARESPVAPGNDSDGVVKRFVASLQDLGSQSEVEKGINRLVTAHAALSAHLANQTRLVQNLAHPLLSPFSPPTDSGDIDILVPLLASILLLVPTPASGTLSALHGLHNSTATLIGSLSYFSDTLHMSRQTTTLAARRLRASKELVEEMRREREEAEEGIRWVENGSWEDKLSRRECAQLCREVVGGFEEVCKGWRARLEGGYARAELEVGAA